jgi:putative endonuclease
MNQTYYVYIITNQHNTVLYTGVTSDLDQRVFEHKTGRYKGFTSKYNCNKLVYFEEFSDVEEAIKREKQLKRYRRDWKENLIKKMNPTWNDLSEGWYDPKSIQFGIEVNKGM